MSSDESQHQIPLSPQTCVTITCFKKQEQTCPRPVRLAQRIPINHCFWVKLWILFIFPVYMCTISSLYVYTSISWGTTGHRRKARQGQLFAGTRFENIFKYLSFPCSLPTPPLWVYECSQSLTKSYPKKKLIIVITLTTVLCLQAKLKARIKIFQKTGSNICSFGEYPMISNT